MGDAEPCSVVGDAMGRGNNPDATAVSFQHTQKAQEPTPLFWLDSLSNS